MKNDRAETLTRACLLCLPLAFGIPMLAQAGQEAKPRWQSEWEKTLAGAKREGQVNVYTHDGQSPILESGAFQKKYPEIKIVYTFTRGTRPSSVSLPSGEPAGI